MKNFALLICVLLASFSTSLAISDDHIELPVFGGVETFACDFVDGKGMDDLMKVTKKWDKWADKIHSVAYTGLVLSPSTMMRSMLIFIGWVFLVALENRRLHKLNMKLKALKCRLTLIPSILANHTPSQLG